MATESVGRRVIASAQQLAGSLWRRVGLILTRVRAWWVHGVLDQSLETIAWVELGLQRRPDAVRPRAGLITYWPDGQDGTPPSGRSIAAAFDELGQALLILGAPGSGKTTLLLDGPYAYELAAHLHLTDAQPSYAA